MVATQSVVWETLVRDFGPMQLTQPMSRAEFYGLMEKLPDLQMEREKNGTVILMSPVKRSIGNKEAKVIFFLGFWHYQTNLGKYYSSSTIFDLPDGSSKSPDCAWLSDETLATLPEQDDESDAYEVVPDFVVEVRSKSDRLKNVQKKMEEDWMANGVKLGWLIDPLEEKTYIYRRGVEQPEVLVGFAGKFLDGENVLPAFRLPLEELKKK